MCINLILRLVTEYFVFSMRFPLVFVFADISHSLILHLVMVMVSQLHFCVEV